MPAVRPTDAFTRVRQLMLGLLVLGLVGIGTELILMAHYEDSWQLTPLVLIAAALVVVGWHLIDSGSAVLRVLQATMALCIVAGVIGVILHYRGNLEFQLEMDPSQSQWALFTKAMHAKVPPALAPGVMAQLGLLGLLYTFRHPGLRRSES
jgi:hypothetical protein